MNGSKLRQIWVILTEREVSIRKNHKSSQPPSGSQSLVDPSKQTVDVLREGLYPHTVPSSIPSPDGLLGAEAVESEGSNRVKNNSSVELTTRAGGAAANPRRGRDGISSRGDDAHYVQIREETSNGLANLWIKALVSLSRDGDRNTRQVIESWCESPCVNRMCRWASSIDTSYSPSRTERVTYRGAATHLVYHRETHCVRPKGSYRRAS
ncbi:hypothetical protein K456DRAFT_380792 [Colletotrichum gloeosporioides 23]|nr:hypothetical protein K456DRAFT_380792 [Colletotrichum gloeosporioides 23]